ncbi:hypothetical protein LCGC14_2266580 [marine sediment metagenome]|uniref:Uncharacterized protein n=1 Tax=marine sediment metagenome TaxID=412755 RepID=A0A0F9FT95_9ZZZZ
MSRDTPYTVKELIEALQPLPLDATVEFEVPKRLPGARCETMEGVRVFVTDIREVFYDSPNNKWVVLS